MEKNKFLKVTINVTTKQYTLMLIFQPSDIMENKNNLIRLKGFKQESDMQFKTVPAFTQKLEWRGMWAETGKLVTKLWDRVVVTWTRGEEMEREMYDRQHFLQTESGDKEKE